MLKRMMSVLAVGLFALLSVGCCPNQRMNVTVELDDAMKQRLAELSGRNIQVDIVALNSAEHQRWKDYSMTTYWTPPYELKNSVPVYSMIFDPGKSTSQTLSAKDSIWDKWWANASDKDQMRLYVVALLPGTFDDKPGNTDARRQIMPLGKCRWNGDTVKIQVQRAGIRTLTNFKIKVTD